jgi:hypothetical protein
MTTQHPSNKVGHPQSPHDGWLASFRIDPTLMRVFVWTGPRRTLRPDHLRAVGQCCLRLRGVRRHRFHQPPHDATDQRPCDAGLISAEVAISGALGSVPSNLTGSSSAMLSTALDR